MDLAAGSPILGRRNGVKKTPGGAGKGSSGGGSGSGNGSGSGMVGIGGVSGSRNGGVRVDDDDETPRGSRVSILSSSRGSKPGACIAAATAATAAAASRSAKKSKTRSNVSRFGEEDAADEFETDFVCPYGFPSPKPSEKVLLLLLFLLFLVADRRLYTLPCRSVRP